MNNITNTIRRDFRNNNAGMYWSDFDIEMKKVRPGIHTAHNGFGGDVLRKTDIDAIENSLTNILGTLQGSRRMLPEFALGLYHILFEPIDPGTTNIIRNYIISAINHWDNRVELKGVDIRSIPDENRYEIKIVYSIRNKIVSNQTHELTYILKRLE